MAKPGEWFGAALFNQIKEWDKGLTNSIRGSQNKPSAPLDPSKYPKAVPGGYTMTPQHARGSDGFADRTWLHPDLPGPKGNEVGSGDPSLVPPAPIIDTTQAATTPIVMRSHDDAYVSAKQQWGDNPQVKAAADKGFEVGKAYRAGNPLDDVPAYIRAGSEEYMNRADMLKVVRALLPTPSAKL